eukprot:CAMPEP_0205919294 /NCGR_PEP_ID=MMETSP1325-20131115/10349_1 /ASSEMBLY_ACC=CAM_ASM_000708 /TAXON_ID=236786 /ORGANISM="Florenciella sp., Strain RCC1007" /LENGTH=47 /DNA_ID= /DNA_START= /DNA_END= /DNA_ORIENTATION=
MNTMLAIDAKLSSSTMTSTASNVLDERATRLLDSLGTNLPRREPMAG